MDHAEADPGRTVHGLARTALVELKRALGRTVWSIGVYAGPSPLELAPAPERANPVLTWREVTDAFAVAVADPFLLRLDGGWHMFFEVLVQQRRGTRGAIGHATSRDGFHWAYHRLVLKEPFHVSYPHVFTVGSDVFMIPETEEAGSVRLYRAEPFPDRWVHVRDLLSGPGFLDSTVFRREDRWWMMTATSADRRRDVLRLYHARALTGPWQEHPCSPVAGDRRTARPAGGVVSVEGRLVRWAQGGHPTYGSDVRAVEITRLTPDEYGERELGGNPVLAGSRRGWNSRGMHHLDAHPLGDGRWIAAVDGWYRGLVRPREIARQLAAAVP